MQVTVLLECFNRFQKNLSNSAKKHCVVKSNLYIASGIFRGSFSFPSRSHFLWILHTPKGAMLAIKIQCQHNVFMQAEYEAIYINFPQPWLYMKPFFVMVP